MLGTCYLNIFLGVEWVMEGVGAPEAKYYSQVIFLCKRGSREIRYGRYILYVISVLLVWSASLVH